MRTLVAILAMSSCTAFAQTHSPAQPASTPALEASLHRPAALSASTPTSVAPPATTKTIDVNNLTAPRLVHDAQFSGTSSDVLYTRPHVRTVVVDLTVSTTGKPTDLKVLHSNDPLANQAVLRTVSQYQYQPATANGVAVPMHVTLTYNIKPDDAE